MNSPMIIRIIFYLVKKVIYQLVLGGTQIDKRRQLAACATFDNGNLKGNVKWFDERGIVLPFAYTFWRGRPALRLLRANSAFIFMCQRSHHFSSLFVRNEICGDVALY